MSIIYRTTGAWGPGKGGNLTAAEVDGNFYTLVQDIAQVADDLVPAEIANITLVGSQLTFVLSDGRTLGPYTVPTAAFRWAGVWAPNTAYLANDFLETGQGVFLVTQNHTSAATFDPARVIGGDPVYVLVFREPRSEVFTVTASTFQPVAAQVWGYIRCTAACAITLPANATEALPVGVEFHFRQAGSGALTIAGAAGVTVDVPSGLLAATDRQGATVTVKKVATNTWDVFGLLARDD
jgi:hypothetical protein